MDKGLLASAGAGRRGRVAAAVLTLLSAPAAAQTTTPAPMATSAPSPVFAIRGFTISGDNPLSDAETIGTLTPFQRPDATIETLQQATAALEATLRARGFGLHRVSLPPQEVGDTVRLNIVRFTINRVTIEGREINDEGNIRRSVGELREGGTPNFRKLAVQTAIANENPNKQIQISLRESDESDKIDATITVKEARPWTFALTVSNYGSKSSGKDRVTVAGGHTNLWNLDHQFIAAYTTSVERSDDVKQLGVSYRAPLYETGGVVGLSYTKSDVVGNFGTFSSTGAGHTSGVSYTHYLYPEGARRTYVTVDFENKLFDAPEINGVVVPGTSDRRSTPLGLSFSSRTESEAAVYGYTVGFAFNTRIGDNNSRAAYQTEDPRIDTARWKAVRANGSYASSLGAGNSWLWTVRGQAQYSPDVLIAGEQFGLGGILSVRGTENERPIAGDKGVSGSFELTTPELTQGLRLLGFVDAGYLRNNDPNGTSKPRSDSLASVGLGLRYSRGFFLGAIDYGRIVNGSKVSRAINTSAPKSGEDKLYLSLSLRF